MHVLAVPTARCTMWCRRLHARHAKGVGIMMADESFGLSPIHGLFLFGTPALASLWAGGEAGGPAVARLARALFNRHQIQEPLRPTRNKSLPAAHLTPTLQGACLGLALSQASREDVRRCLVKLGVDELAREQGVSIARFEGLVGLIAEAAVSRQPRHMAQRSAAQCSGGDSDSGSSNNAGSGACVGVGVHGASVVLAHVWACAHSKRCLLDFLMALQEHMPNRLFRANVSCAEWRERFLADNFDEFEVEYMLGGGSRSIAPGKQDLDALCEGSAPVPLSAIERLAFTLVARHRCSPEVMPGHSHSCSRLVSPSPSLPLSPRLRRRCMATWVSQRSRTVSRRA